MPIGSQTVPKQAELPAQDAEVPAELGVVEQRA